MSNINEAPDVIQAMIDRATEGKVDDAYDRLHEIVYSEKKGKITPKQADTIIKCLNGVHAMCEDLTSQFEGVSTLLADAELRNVELETANKELREQLKNLNSVLKYYSNLLS